MMLAPKFKNMCHMINYALQNEKYLHFVISFFFQIMTITLGSGNSASDSV